ncbi:hypothetical protein GSI_01450 [Ganoderma sinense ZZ0214-1]|uniref:HNH nuclease domain-containing protein n=1 Tax=Ganoderma sinense ZZ0214-1 TaxID=1077348 RepID=A0A2G8SVF6_9APHY|nr:hypothetical protein GSI_01450 [Ganoderma sinense ZZ0214-1]
MADFRSPHPLRSDFAHPSPAVVSAYTICHAAERVVDPIQDHWPPDDPTMKTRLINIRILGHLLSQTGFLSDAAISRVATSVFTCRKDPAGTDEADVEALNELGEFYRDHLLRPFRKFKSLTPNISSPPSPPSFKLSKEEVDQMLAEPHRSHSQSRHLAMQREDFRCIVTRTLDKPYAKALRPPGYPKAQTLEFCHIFPESTNCDVDDNAKKRGVWNALESLGYTNVVNDFATAEKIHSLENTMMMVFNVCDNFDTLDLWFEPIEGVPNRYRIRSLLVISPEIADGQEVTFQSADSRLALPNPEYLRIHAACCRVANLSGASGLFYEIEGDLMSDPDPTTEGPEFARALHTHLDHLSLTAVQEAH